MKSSQKSNRAFTLIELLVVISIIGLLSSVVLASLNNTRLKALDAKRKSDLAEIQKGIELYFANTNTMPGNKTPCCVYFDSNADFLNELETAGIFSSVPRDPKSPSRNYWYYNYPASGYFLGVILEGDSSKNPDYSSYSGTAGLCKPGAGNYYCLHGNNN